MKIVRLIVLSAVALAVVLSRKSKEKGDYLMPCACSNKTFPREKSNDEKSVTFCKLDLTCDCNLQMCHVAQGGNCEKQSCATGLKCVKNDSLKYKACAPKTKRFK
jgi:hypothetical protein